MFNYRSEKKGIRPLASQKTQLPPRGKQDIKLIPTITVATLDDDETSGRRELIFQSQITEEKTPLSKTKTTIAQKVPQIATLPKNHPTNKAGNLKAKEPEPEPQKDSRLSRHSKKSKPSTSDHQKDENNDLTQLLDNIPRPTRTGNGSNLGMSRTQNFKRPKNSPTQLIETLYKPEPEDIYRVIDEEETFDELDISKID